MHITFGQVCNRKWFMVECQLVKTTIYSPLASSLLDNQKYGKLHGAAFISIHLQYNILYYDFFRYERRTVYVLLLGAPTCLIFSYSFRFFIPKSDAKKFEEFAEKYRVKAGYNCAGYEIALCLCEYITSYQTNFSGFSITNAISLTQ